MRPFVNNAKSRVPTDNGMAAVLRNGRLPMSHYTFDGLLTISKTLSSTRLFAERMGREASDSNMPVTTTCTLTSVVASKWMDSEHLSQITKAIGAQSAVQTMAEPIQVFVAHRMMETIGGGTHSLGGWRI